MRTEALFAVFHGVQVSLPDSSRTVCSGTNATSHTSDRTRFQVNAAAFRNV